MHLYRIIEKEILLLSILISIAPYYTRRLHRYSNGTNLRKFSAFDLYYIQIKMISIWI